MSGGPGDDVIHGEGGNDVLYGGTGSDDLIGGWHADTLYANSSDPTEVETTGNRLHGGPQDDVLYGSGGNDVLYGGVGVDYLYGVSGTNTLCENALKTSSSFLGAGDPQQEIFGGSGSFDTLEYLNSNLVLNVLGSSDVDFLHFDFPPSGVGVVWNPWASPGTVPLQAAAQNAACYSLKSEFGAF